MMDIGQCQEKGNTGADKVAKETLIAVQGVLEKSSPLPKTFWNIFTSVM